MSSTNPPRRIAYAMELALPVQKVVVPAKAGTHPSTGSGADRWVPAVAGTTTTTAPFLITRPSAIAILLIEYAELRSIVRPVSTGVAPTDGGRQWQRAS